MQIKTALLTWLAGYLICMGGMYLKNTSDCDERERFKLFYVPLFALWPLLLVANVMQWIIRRYRNGPHVG